MSKFNVLATRPATTAPITTTGPAVNHEHAAGYAREPKSELFLLAVANMVGEDTFYEHAGDRDDRYGRLVRQVAVDDPAWTARFLAWLRGDANMRSAALTGAAEAARAMRDAGVPGGRQIIASVLQRADEPGEMLAYWTSRHGRAVPKPVKRGVADAVRRLYDERALLKYDTASHGYRFGDVIDLVHPTPAASWQGDLFAYALDRRHGRDNKQLPASLGVVVCNVSLRLLVGEEPEFLLDPAWLKRAGVTWEDALSLAGDRVDKAKLWAALIPSMGYAALLRNLRNFDEHGVSDQAAAQVIARLTDPDQVARSRQFPFRFYAAYKAVTAAGGGLRWAYALEKALAASLANVPALPGRTLVLVDQSPSMFPGYHFSTRQQHRDISNADLAKLFGTAVALRAENATLVGYGNSSYEVPFGKTGAVLTIMASGFRMDDGTDTFGALARRYAGHDRVIIVTDEQHQPAGWRGRHRTVDDTVPAHVPVYVWNIGGYAVGSTASGPNRHTFAGLTDHAFRMIPLLEGRTGGAWPWETTP